MSDVVDRSTANALFEQALRGMQVLTVMGVAWSLSILVNLREEVSVLQAVSDMRLAYSRETFGELRVDVQALDKRLRAVEQRRSEGNLPSPF